MVPNPLGNTQSLTYTPIASGFTVLHATPLGRQTSYETHFVSGVDQRVETQTDAAGLTTTLVTRPDHQARFASPDDPTHLLYDAFRLRSDGGAEYMHFTPDPRFGTNASFLAQSKTLQRGDGTGPIQTRSSSRSYTLIWLFQYDAVGNLLTVGLPQGDLITYLVDGMGRRVGKKKNGVLLKQWIYRDALKPAVELDGSGT